MMAVDKERFSAHVLRFSLTNLLSIGSSQAKVGSRREDGTW